jgi:hypothetical protein
MAFSVMAQVLVPLGDRPDVAIPGFLIATLRRQVFL